MTMKKVFWNVAPCTCCIKPPSPFSSCSYAHAGSSLVNFSFFSTLKKGAIRSSETSVYTISTRLHISEDGIIQTFSSLRRRFIKLVQSALSLNLPVSGQLYERLIFFALILLWVPKR